jgi:hypothetical protein
MSPKPASGKSPTVRAGRILDAEVHLLDRQVLDVDGVPVTTVDDLELSDIPFGEDLPVGGEGPVVLNLLSGPILGTRIFGGRPPKSRWIRTPWDLISELGIVVSLAAHGEDLDVTWTERWARDRIISRIPGGRHDPE